MKKTSRVYKAGTRPSNLSIAQTRAALDKIEEVLPEIGFEVARIHSAGDSDRDTDLRESPDDFFTRELNAAVLAGEVDCAIHSAKDLPDELSEGIDWFWLPWREDPRDVLVVSEDWKKGSRAPVVGVSSDRRAEYCSRRFPEAVQKPVRGNIEERLAQLDDGKFDIIVMAAAGLLRLGLGERISEWIPLAEMPVPAGQGYLAVTYRAADGRMRALRNLYVKAVVIAGAGAGRAELCTTATVEALRRCDVCLYDSLMDAALLEFVPEQALAIDVGKRCGSQKKSQEEITRLICDNARRGRKVVRLKGGDPGIFGRLSEETDALTELGLPFRVIPGISALQSATTATGILLTKRGTSSGFCAMTPRKRGGGLGSVAADARAKLPMVFFMSVKCADQVAEELIADGLDSQTPAAVVFDAGGDEETIVRASLKRISEEAKKIDKGLPGLLIVGEPARLGFEQTFGALGGRRVLLTCSQALQPKAAALVRDFGGRPVQGPLIRLKPDVQALDNAERILSKDWTILTSPSAVRCLMGILSVDVRKLPKIMVCGAGTARELERRGILPDAMPEAGFGTESMLELARKHMQPGEKVLRLRSDKAGPWLARAIRELGMDVDDCVLYENERVNYGACPDFDSVFFASASAVASFFEQWGRAALSGKTILVMGGPTARELEKHDITSYITARKASVSGAISTLAEHFVALLSRNCL